MSKIYSYADRSWQPIKGCDESLPCAEHCWAKRECHRLAGNPNAKIAAFHQGLTDANGNWTGLVKLNEAHLTDPLKWREPQTVAVAYHGDLFLAPDDVIDRVFVVMALCPQHTFLVLTKRPEQAAAYFTEDLMGCGAGDRVYHRSYGLSAVWQATQSATWPLPNVWLGVSVTNQADADARIPLLLQTPAAKRWVSYEPAVGAVDFDRIARADGWHLSALSGVKGVPDFSVSGKRLDWIVMGGESGPGARPMHPDWARSIRDQCQAAGAPFMFKQWGEWTEFRESGLVAYPPSCERIEVDQSTQPMQCKRITLCRVGKRAAGRLLDGKEWNEMPKATR